MYLLYQKSNRAIAPSVMFIDLSSDPIFKLIYRRQLPNVKNIYEFS